MRVLNLVWPRLCSHANSGSEILIELYFHAVVPFKQSIVPLKQILVFGCDVCDGSVQSVEPFCQGSNLCADGFVVARLWRDRHGRFAPFALAALSVLVNEKLKRRDVEVAASMKKVRYLKTSAQGETLVWFL